jgi:hypothetical protein
MKTVGLFLRLFNPLFAIIMTIIAIFNLNVFVIILGVILWMYGWYWLVINHLSINDLGENEFIEWYKVILSLITVGLFFPLWIIIALIVGMNKISEFLVELQKFTNFKDEDYDNIS